jgi:tetratricopeptide (TPR) repeat protein
METERPQGAAAREMPCPLVGRDAEIGLLEANLAAVEERGEARIVTLIGPAGIGKTRIVEAFLARRASRADAPRAFRGSARDGAASFAPFARLLRDRFSLGRGMDPDAARAEMRRKAAEVLEERKIEDAVHFLGQLLGLPPDEASAAKRAVSDEDPQEAELMRRAVIRSFLEADAQRGPLVLVLEDLHEAYDDSLSLLRYLLEYLSGAILVVCTGNDDLLYRHEDWGRVGERRHALLELTALGEADIERVARSMLTRCARGDEEVPAPLVGAACAFARGNPGLIAQMVRIYLDAGLLEETNEDGETRYRVHLDRLEGARLPATIADAVEARIAALSPEEREICEQAAAMGGVFWSGAFIALARTGREAPELWDVTAAEDAARMARLLAGLYERSWIERRAESIFPGSDEYAWKRSEEREAILRATGAAALKLYNRVIADWMDHQPGLRMSEERVADLARHREQAGDAMRAGLSYLEAASVARRRYANVKACEYYQRGLVLLDDTHDGQRIDALHDYGDVLSSMGYVEDALAAFRQMLTLAYRLDLQSKGGAAHNRIGRLYRDIGSFDEAERHIQTAMALFEAAGDERGVASTIDDRGKIAWLKGEYDAALEDFRDGLLRRRTLGDTRSIALSLNNLGLALQDSGQFKEALEAFEQSLSLRREVGDLVGVVTTLNNLGTIAQERRNFDKATRLFAEALDVAQQIGDRNKIALVLTNVGETYYRSGEPEQAIRVLLRAESLCDELGDRLKLAETLRGLGKAYLLHGDLCKARDYIGRAVDLFAMVRCKVHLATALRTLAEITAAGGCGSAHTTSAREYFDRAVAIFEQSGNEVELARTFKTYARFLREHPELAEDAEARRDAGEMETRADSIFARLERTHLSKSEVPSGTAETTAETTA